MQQRGGLLLLIFDIIVTAKYYFPFAQAAALIFELKNFTLKIQQNTHGTSYFKALVHLHQHW